MKATNSILAVHCREKKVNWKIINDKVNDEKVNYLLLTVD